MNNWFQISDQGFKRVNAGRKMGHLIREAISNSLDRDDVKNITILINPEIVTVQDDSAEGIVDPDLIYTVFLTDKEDSHLMRGRKGRGLKELISAANSAIVETVGKTIIFDEMGRREQDNDRETGTRITVRSEAWTADKIPEALDYLRKIIVPNGVNLEVNDMKLGNPDANKFIEGELKTTIIENGIEQVVNKNTTVSVIDLREGEDTGWIHEMGIPIQEIEADFHVDVAQRVPMNDNRDVVNPEYLKDVFALILNAVIDEMPDEELTAKWVATGLSKNDWNLNLKFSNRFARGKQLLKKSSNEHANDLAKQNGYELLDTSNLDPNIRNALYYMKSTETYMEEEQEASERLFVDPPSEDHEKFLKVMTFLSKKLLDKDVACKFMTKKAYDGITNPAVYQRSTATVFFNLESRLDYTKPLTVECLAILFHELAHDKYDIHDEDLMDEIAMLGAKMSLLILEYPDLVKDQFGVAKKGKTSFITCVDCGAQREVKVQDVFQVKRCQECQKKHKREKARLRRIQIRERSGQ